MRIWLDMANSPHPVLFRAVAKDLWARGHELVVTTRDHGQTKELTLAVWPDALVVGDESPQSRLAKGRAIAARIAALYRHVRGRGIDVAASLNSYAQVVAARLARVPAVTLMDYEYQPANHLSFRLASTVIVPEAFPAHRLRRYGARRSRVLRLPGLKEELYLDEALAVGERTGATRGGGSTALFRAPAEGSLYHPGANAAFEALLEHAARRPDVDVVALPRLRSQRERYQRLDGVTVPERAVDGMALLLRSDVFVGAGGTMSREAALLGVRAYTMFAGPTPAVDASLMQAGRLHELAGVEPSRVDWSPRAHDARLPATEAIRARGQALKTWFADAIEAAAVRA